MQQQDFKWITFEHLFLIMFLFAFRFFAVSVSREQGPRLVSIKDEHARLLDENQKMKVSNETLEVLLLATTDV